MKLVVLAAFGLVLSLLAVTSTAEDFDFFYFVQQWPGSFCDTRECCYPDDVKPAADFGIHGLWPNYAKCDRDDDLRRHGLARTVLGDDALLRLASTVGQQGKCWPEFCDDDNELILSQIGDLVASLDWNWPTLSCKNSESFEFWSYEWKKHGTCSNLEQHDYFKRALELKAAHNLTAILADAGIVPSDTETYPLSSVRDAITQASATASTTTPTAWRSCTRCTSASTKMARGSSIARCTCEASAPTGSSCHSSDCLFGLCVCGIIIKQ